VVSHASRRADRSSRLTGPAEIVSARIRDRILDRFTGELAAACEGQPRWRELVITLPALRRALSGTGRKIAWDEPFRWKPAFVRRSLGLAAIDACRHGLYRSPAQAVGPVADDAVTMWQRSGWRTYHWEPWLSYQPPGARAVVLAEASRWATSLWCAFDWSALPPEVRVGGPDEQWRCPPNGTVRLKGRVDLRVGLAAGEALVVAAAGVPTRTWDTDLAYPALVAALCRPRRPVPCRVMGIWPDAGEHHFAEIGAEALQGAAARVVAAVTAMAGSCAADGCATGGCSAGGYAEDSPAAAAPSRV
jgi:hypothetical protein